MPDNLTRGNLTPGSLTPIHSAEQLIDSQRYPLGTLDSAEGQRFLAACQADLAEDGALVMPAFLRPEAVDAILAEADDLAPQSYFCSQSHNPYLAEPLADLPADHPRNALQKSDLGCVADDLIPADSPLRRLYGWQPLRDFLARLLGYPALHPIADPLGSLNINYAHAGQELGWHFDNADFATTLLLRPAEDGGVFEFAANIRGQSTHGCDSDAGYAAVGRALAGNHGRIRRLDMPAGTFVLFKGRNSLHRVTPVVGRQARIIAILSYAAEPGVQLTEFNRRLFYGRVA